MGDRESTTEFRRRMNGRTWWIVGGGVPVTGGTIALLVWLVKSAIAAGSMATNVTTVQTDVAQIKPRVRAVETKTAMNEDKIVSFKEQMTRMENKLDKLLER